MAQTSMPALTVESVTRTNNKIKFKAVVTPNGASIANLKYAVIPLEGGPGDMSVIAKPRVGPGATGILWEGDTTNVKAGNHSLVLMIQYNDPVAVGGNREISQILNVNVLGPGGFQGDIGKLTAGATVKPTRVQLSAGYQPPAGAGWTAKTLAWIAHHIQLVSNKSPQ
ncbi:MAG: hypothetical protein JO270_11895 [Acidobacteriaceae bacterium]|nr:hypothetical protein [Acidobacteriaceae bacterium]